MRASCPHPRRLFGGATTAAPLRRGGRSRNECAPPRERLLRAEPGATKIGARARLLSAPRMMRNENDTQMRRNKIRGAPPPVGRNKVNKRRLAQIIARRELVSRQVRASSARRRSRSGMGGRQKVAGHARHPALIDPIGVPTEAKPAAVAAAETRVSVRARVGAEQAANLAPPAVGPSFCCRRAVRAPLAAALSGARCQLTTVRFNARPRRRRRRRLTN